MHYSPGLGTADDAEIIVLLESIAGFGIPAYDYIGVAYPIATTEVFTFKVGGAGGVTVGTLTVVYTDASKANLSSVTKS